MAHTSPAAPQPGGAWHRATPFMSGAQLPEQHSAADVHSSHSAAHPPAGAQRRVPSPLIWQRREQQSSLIPHTSPTWAWQSLPSLAWQFASGAQRPTPFGSTVHTLEQQSAPLWQISPSTRHACSKAHRIEPSAAPAQAPPQQSMFMPHVSPAGRQPGSCAHMPPAHRSLQQSRPWEHGRPAGTHIDGGASTHSGALSGASARHVSEQQAPA
jgi:hypothetical protein